jgi:hypothetical protein
VWNLVFYKKKTSETCIKGKTLINNLVKKKKKIKKKTQKFYI